jgi:hypothetical protein
MLSTHFQDVHLSYCYAPPQIPRLMHHHGGYIQNSQGVFSFGITWIFASDAVWFSFEYAQRGTAQAELLIEASETCAFHGEPGSSSWSAPSRGNIKERHCFTTRRTFEASWGNLWSTFVTWCRQRADPPPPFTPFVVACMDYEVRQAMAVLLKQA